MQVFLKDIAKQIIDEHGTDLSDQYIVFPNRRSALYFRHYLSLLVEKPVLAPALLTINELFAEFTDTEVSDPLLLIFKLYEAYLEIKGGKETFDEFYFWGEMIINDFDDIDKYLVNHGLLFQNLKDLRDIDAKFGGLEPEIVEIIRKFWQSFDPGNITSEKEDFLAVWDILIILYDTF